MLGFGVFGSMGFAGYKSAAVVAGAMAAAQVGLGRWVVAWTAVVAAVAELQLVVPAESQLQGAQMKECSKAAVQHPLKPLPATSEAPPGAVVLAVFLRQDCTHTSLCYLANRPSCQDLMKVGCLAKLQIALMQPGW